MHRYTGTETITYPYARLDGGTRPLQAVPGMEPVEFDEPPADGRWEEVKPAPKKKAPSAAQAVKE